ncbi:MAG: UDP-N-acetylmuramoyl-tripeptide--D-alanyl-D-alanine ligase [Clostridia bacterium]|nr:UDP-N-acetylmuramoyl-tripeptide--D-alanyl-D-alanine ligase [Clostridia bacterium]
MRIETGEPIDPSQFGYKDVFSPVRAIATDSREIRPGDLFVALKGEKTDGADHIQEAIARGAPLILTHRACEHPGVLAVGDPIKALSDAAARYAASIPHKTVGITGSYGKTTLRHHLTEILSPALPVAFTEGNGNTDLSVSLTLLSMPKGTRILLAELGMRGRGEIARLSRLVKPDVAVITGIGSAHIGFLGSKEEVCRAKCEIVLGMQPDGLLLYPANDPMLVAEAPSLPVCSRSVSIDLTYPADYSLRIVGAADEKTLISVSSPSGESFPVLLPGCDAPTLSSAAFCIAVCQALGIKRDTIQNGLPRITPPPLRRQVVTVGGVTVILDCYNASPEPTVAALASLSRYRDEGKRLFLLLGDMLELGEASIPLHRMVGNRAAMLSPERLFCVGIFADAYSDGAVDAGLTRERIGRYPSDAIPELAAEIKSKTAPGDLLFVKGSRALALEKVVDYLKEAEN